MSSTRLWGTSRSWTRTSPLCVPCSRSDTVRPDLQTTRDQMPGSSSFEDRVPGPGHVRGPSVRRPGFEELRTWPSPGTTTLTRTARPRDPGGCSSCTCTSDARGSARSPPCSPVEVLAVAEWHLPQVVEILHWTAEPGEIRLVHGDDTHSTKRRAGDRGDVVWVHRIRTRDRLGGFRVDCEVRRSPRMDHRSAFHSELLAFCCSGPSVASQTASQLEQLLVCVCCHGPDIYRALESPRSSRRQLLGHRRSGSFLRVGFGFPVCHCEEANNRRYRGASPLRRPVSRRCLCAHLFGRVSLSVSRMSAKYTVV